MKIKPPIFPVATAILCLLFTGLSSFSDSSPGISTPEKPEPAIVQEKIALLGLRDDSIPWQERPEYWLKSCRERIIPELMKGLDSDKKRVALGCLQILEKIPNHPEILDSLVGIARDETHIINHATTLSLCQFFQDSRVPQIMDQALAGDRFPDPRERSRIAEAAGRKEEAANYLIPLLKRKQRDYDMVRDIRRLGEIGHAAAIKSLKKITHSNDWGFAVEAYLSLANIDPQGHGLTKEQEEFITQSRRSFKANRETYVKHWKTLARLNKAEIRPYVLQMMKTDHPSAALVILQEWKDKDALEEIRQQILSQRIWRLGEFVTAYLRIEGTDKSIEEILSLFKKRKTGPGSSYSGSVSPKYRPLSEFDIEDIIRSIYRSELPQERQLQSLQKFRGYFGDKYAPKFPRTISQHKGNREILLQGLMQQETYLPALVEYARIAARDKQNRYAKEVSQVLEVLSQQNNPQDEKITGWILEILAAGRLAETGQRANTYLVAPELLNQLLAAYLAATRGGDREKALRILYDTLANEKFANPTEQRYLDKAAGYLKSIPCRDNKEKQEREELLLQQLGKSTESFAMRILPTCSGTRIAGKLLPILGDNNVKRAVYAAWVLAQHPDEHVRQQGLRRLAIYALFHHSAYQFGAGIDFSIARHITFHQVTNVMRTRFTADKRLEGYSQKPSGMIPQELLQPFELNEQEQEFSIRAYRFTRFKNHHQHMYGFGSFYGRTTPWTVSHIPLLRVIAREDPRLTVFHVQGKMVPHFPHRRQAAQAIAGLTGRNAVYIDLTGEKLDSEAVPQPYANQNNMIAGYVMDLIEQSNIINSPGSGAEWNRREAYEIQIRELIGSDPGRGFGSGLKQALYAESSRREMKEQLTKANFSIWRDLKK